MTPRCRLSTWRAVALISRQVLRRTGRRSGNLRKVEGPSASPAPSAGAAEVPVLEEQIAVDQNEKELLFLVLGAFLVLLAVGSGVLGGRTRSTNLGGGKLVQPEKPAVLRVNEEGEIRVEGLPTEEATLVHVEDLSGCSVVLRWGGQPSRAVDQFAASIDRLSNAGVKVHVQKENLNVKK